MAILDIVFPQISTFSYN